MKRIAFDFTGDGRAAVSAAYEADRVRPPSYFDLLENRHDQEPPPEIAPPPLSVFEWHYLHPKYADLPFGPDGIEPDCASEPAPPTEYEEDYLRYEGFNVPEDLGSEPSPSMDYTDMSGPEEDPEEYPRETNGLAFGRHPLLSTIMHEMENAEMTAP